MRHSFSSMVALFWAVLFATVTFGLIIDFQAAEQGTIAVLGATVAFPSEMSTKFAAFALAICFALASLLFLWGIVLSFLRNSIEEGEQADVLAMAHSVAVVAITSVLLATIFLPGQPAFGPLVLQIGALAASFLACQAERMLAGHKSEAAVDDLRDTARMMAAGAAHNTMLVRITGRERTIAGGNH